MAYCFGCCWPRRRSSPGRMPGSWAYPRRCCCGAVREPYALAGSRGAPDAGGRALMIRVGGSPKTRIRFGQSPMMPIRRLILASFKWVDTAFERFDRNLACHT